MFVPIGYHVNENEKKNRKKKKEKMVWIYGEEGATHKIWPGSIHAAVFEKPEFTDACATADKVKQS